MTSRPRTRLDPQVRREQILVAASRLFSGRAESEVSLDEVAAAAGVARGLINHHFGTKRDLYLEVVRETMRAPELPVPERIAGHTLRERFEETVAQWLDAIDRDPRLWLAAARLQAAGDQDVAEIVTGVRDEMARRTADLLGLGPLEEVSPERRALIEMYRASVEEAVRQWVEHSRLSREQVHRLVVELGLLAADRVPRFPSDL